MNQDLVGTQKSELFVFPEFKELLEELESWKGTTETLLRQRDLTAGSSCHSARYRETLGDRGSDP